MVLLVFNQSVFSKNATSSIFSHILWLCNQNYVQISCCEPGNDRFTPLVPALKNHRCGSLSSTQVWSKGQVTEHPGLHRENLS